LGATFTVTLPLEATRDAWDSERETQVRDEDERQAKKSHAVLAGLHVLLVDDETDTLAMLRMILEQKEVRVTAAASAAEALAALEQATPDVLISDIGMPDEDGYELIRRVRALDAADGRSIPAVALTAYAGEQDRSRALEAGYQVHLSKPVEPMELLRTLGQLSGRVGNGSHAEE
jgi:CheY-like chemotaxis protein